MEEAEEVEAAEVVVGDKEIDLVIIIQQRIKLEYCIM